MSKPSIEKLHHIASLLIDTGNPGYANEVDKAILRITALQAKVEELTKLVASLEEVRAKEYAFKQAKVDEAQVAEHEADHDRQKAWDHADALQAKVAELVEALDNQHGTPCEQIRHQQEVEELTDDRRRLVTHSTILGEYIWGEVTDDPNEAFRALPDHLQIMIEDEENARAALKQAGTGIQDMMAEVEALSQEGAK